MRFGELKAIETRYKGYHFRSRLEARWAVFFDAMGYDWKYEYQGYQVGDTCYLPDFELHATNGDIWYVEVKGKLTAEDCNKMAGVLDYCSPLPQFIECGETGKAGLVLLGDIPFPESSYVVAHPVVVHHQGLHIHWMAFVPGGMAMMGGESLLHQMAGVGPELCIEGDFSKWTLEPKILKLAQYFPKAHEAYQTARGARFEHGETPK